MEKKNPPLKGAVKKPFIINFIALIHTIGPIGFIIFSFTINDYRYSNITHWDWLFDIENTVFVLISPLIAIGIFISHLIGWILSLLFFLSIIVSVSVSFFTGAHNTFTYLEFGFFLLTNVVIFGALISKETREPFFHPTLQWWKHDPRINVSLKLVLENSQQRIEGLTNDISKSGLYMISNAEVQQNDPFRLFLTLEDGNTVEAEARIIWINRGQKASVPPGFGIRFIQTDKPTQKLLKKMIKEKRKEA